MSSLNTIVLSDTHNSLTEKQISEYFSNPIDLIIILGDIGNNDWKLLKDNEVFCKTSKIAVAGNHDSKKMYENINIYLKKCNADIYKLTSESPKLKQLYKTIILFDEPENRSSYIGYSQNSISFTGISGSVKYKNIESPYLKTQRKALEEAKYLPTADIILSHDKPKEEFDNSDCLQKHSHYGLYAIWWYMQRFKAINLHGHIHQIYRKGKEYGFFGIQYIRIKKNKFSNKISIKYYSEKKNKFVLAA